MKLNKLISFRNKFEKKNYKDGIGWINILKDKFKKKIFYRVKIEKKLYILETKIGVFYMYIYVYILLTFNDNSSNLYFY